jgi:hypothetical protein
MTLLVFRESVAHEMDSSDAEDDACREFARATTDRFIERIEETLSDAGIKHVVEVYSVSTCYGVGSPVESEVAVHVEYGREEETESLFGEQSVEVRVCEPSVSVSVAGGGVA